MSDADIPNLIVIRTATGYVCGQFADEYDDEGRGYFDEEAGIVDGHIINAVKHDRLDVALSMLQTKLNENVGV